MGKKSKLLGTVLLILGIACIGMYFVYGNEKNEFKVTFDSDGGTPVTEQIVKKGEKVIKPEDPTKENNEFVEWQLNGQMYVFENAVMSDLNLKAKWNEITITTYKAKLDETEYTADVRSGESLTVEAFNFPSKDGFIVKLYNDKDEEINLQEPLAEDIVIIAKYVEIKTFTVKFDSNGGSKVDSVSVEEGKIVTEPSTTRDGYTLDGWYLGDEKFDFTTPISKDITLKAKWIENGKITVTFKVDDKVYKTVGVKENDKVTRPSNPTKSGYKFVEWQLDGTAFDFNTKITKEITLTATFEEVKTVTVTFDSQGGSTVKQLTIANGAKATKPTDPTRAGYKFVEWQLNNKKFDFNSAVTSNITLKAKWVEVYTVKFDSQGGSSVASQTVASGDKATKPTDPTKTGYKFAGWILDNSVYNFSTPITKDITLVARFEQVVTPTPTPTASPTSTPAPTATIEPDAEK